MQTYSTPQFDTIPGFRVSAGFGLIPCIPCLAFQREGETEDGNENERLESGGTVKFTLRGKGDMVGSYRVDGGPRKERRRERVIVKCLTAKAHTIEHVHCGDLPKPIIDTTSETTASQNMAIQIASIIAVYL